MNIYKGISASTGIGISTVYFANTANLHIPKITILDSEKDAQWEKFENARNQVLETMTKASENTSPEQAAIFQTYCMMLSDPDFVSQVKVDFQKQSLNIEFIINEKVNQFAQNLFLSGDEYLKARADDIKDVYHKVLSLMLNQKVLTAKNIPEGSILVAEYINPSDAMFITQKKLKGIITTEGGKHSHLAILANTYGIPFVYGVENIENCIKTNDTVIVDGNSGTIYVNPDEVVLHVFNEQIKDLEKENNQLAEFTNKSAITKDGLKINLNANIGNVEEGFSAFEAGADTDERNSSVFGFQVSGRGCLMQVHTHTGLNNAHLFYVFHGFDQTLVGKVHGVVVVDIGHIEAVVQHILGNFGGTAYPGSAGKLVGIHFTFVVDGGF